MTPMSGALPAVLALAGRGSLPHAALHKVPLYLHALRSLAAASEHRVLVVVDEGDRERVAAQVRHAGVAAEVCAHGDWWASLRDCDVAGGLLVHDALCPLASTDFIRSVRAEAAARPEVSVLAFRPVTDTVKTVVDSRIQGTIDREGLAALVSPAVVAATVLADALAADTAPPIDDFARLAGWLRARGEVELVRAPSLARRVDDASSVNLLECVDELSRSVRREQPAEGSAERPPAVGTSDAAGPGTH
jgi:2-C-methyl-D-erythritol 4-phosphate cytidylyltransferase